MAATIVLSEDLKRIAEDRAAAAGYADASAYVRALILADAAEPLDPSLEDHLLRALQTPARAMTEADWNKKCDVLHVLHGARDIDAIIEPE